MNTARNIRITTGMKKIELGNENMAILQISDIFRQHREALINRLLSDLPTYINYKFSTPLKKEQLQLIRSKLLDLKNSTINVARYSDQINEVLENETTYLKSEAFYHEINEMIGEELNPAQLILVK